jgi:hypothetical protein
MKHTQAQTMASLTALEDTGGDRQQEMASADTECHPQGSEIHIFRYAKRTLNFYQSLISNTFRIIGQSHSPCLHSSLTLQHQV